MNCKKCKIKIDNYEVYCPKCGVPTGIVKDKMSAFKTFSEVYGKYKANKSKHFSFSLFALLYGIVPLIALRLIENQIFTNLAPILFYMIFLISSAFFTPFLIIPLTKKTDYYSTNSKTSEFKQALAFYPKMLVLTFSFSLYLIILRLVCQGDPILNLVHLVMVFYGIAIAMPVPLLISEKQLKPLNAIKIAYKSGLYTYRWQNFFMTLILMGLNLFAFFCFLFAYKLTVYNELSAWISYTVLFILGSGVSFIVFPLSWQLIKELYHKLDENHVFDKYIEKQISE